MTGRYKLANPLEVQKRSKKKATKKKTDQQPVAPELEVPDTSVVDIKERPVLVPSKDKEVMQAIGLVRQYLRDTGVNANMNKFTVGLLQGKVLPYNPYPGYVRRFRRLSEKFYYQREALPVVQRRMSQCPTNQTGSGVIASVKMPEIHVWGLQHILSSIDPKMIEQLRNPILSAVVPNETLKEKCGRDVSMITVMTGPSIFVGSIHSYPFKITLNESILVTESDLQGVGKQLGKAVLCDIEHIYKHELHTLLSIQVPIEIGDLFVTKTWGADNMENLLSAQDSIEKENFIQTVGYAALKKQETSVKFLIGLNPQEGISFTMQHITAEKVYNVMALVGDKQNPGAPTNPETLYISSAPHQAIHEGLFLVESEAELYVSTYKKHATLKSPISTQVTNTVQRIWQENVCQTHLESDAINATHYMYLMERTQNQTKPSLAQTEDSIAIQIVRLMQCTGVKLERIFPLISSLCLISTSKTLTTKRADLFENLLVFCRTSLEEFFDETSHELPSTTGTAKRVIFAILHDLDKVCREKKFEEAESKLLFMEGYLKSISMGLVDDALDQCPVIKTSRKSIEEAVGFSFGSNSNVDTRPDAYKHKTETTWFVNTDQKRLNMDQCAQTIRAPPNLSEQASLLQYCADMRIDEVWKGFLETLLLVRDSLPPNPYPLLMTAFRQASLNVQLSHESDASIAKRLMVNKPKLYDPRLDLYSIPNISAFGTLPALSVINMVGFRQVGAMAANLAITPPVPGSGTPTVAAGSFQLRCLPVLAEEMLFYGSVSPFIVSVKLHEHCFVKGPRNQEHEGILSLTKILLVNLSNLTSQGILAVNALFSEVDMDITDIVNSSMRFQNEFVSTVQKHQPVVLNLLFPLDWRYVKIEKVIHVYYVDEVNDETKFLTKHNPVHPYMQVFFNANDAVEYTRRTSKQVTEDFVGTISKEIAEAWRECRWEVLARLLLVYSFRNKPEVSSDQASIAVISFCWKLYHSAYGDLQYAKYISEALASSVDVVEPTRDLVKTMVFGYRNVLNAVVSRPSTLTTSVVDTYCQHLIQRVTECNLSLGTMNVSSVKDFKTVLLHVKSVIQAISDSTAMDLIKSSSFVYSLVKELCNQHPGP